jgi:predicted transcriptional regulator of viral defense system
MAIRITTEKAIALFKKYGGVLRTNKAINLGINPKTLYIMRDNGYIESIDRGVFRLIDGSIDTTNIDIITAKNRLPKGVICLISALSFHGLTTQIPRFVYVAFQQGWRQPKVEYPPVKIFRYSKSAFEAGIEYHVLNGIRVPIYSPAKTVVDCFKFRNRVGLDVAVEALKDFWHKNKSATTDELLKYAKICRVVNTISPYLETFSS